MSFKPFVILKKKKTFTSSNQIIKKEKRKKLVLVSGSGIIWRMGPIETHIYSIWNCIPFQTKDRVIHILLLLLPFDFGTRVGKSFTR
jgi:hypothetical protein